MSKYTPAMQPARPARTPDERKVVDSEAKPNAGVRVPAMQPVTPPTEQSQKVD